MTRTIPIVSTAIMQFLSAGKESLREKTHACDAGLQAGNCSLAIGAGLVDCLHCQPHSLLVAKGQLARGLEDAVCVNSLYLLGHSTAPGQRTASRPSVQQRRSEALGLVKSHHETRSRGDVEGRTGASD